MSEKSVGQDSCLGGIVSKRPRFGRRIFVVDSVHTSDWALDVLFTVSSLINSLEQSGDCP